MVAGSLTIALNPVPWRNILRPWLCAVTHAIHMHNTHMRLFTCICVRVCNRCELQDIVRGGSAKMCSPVCSLYPPVLTPLGGRPPGNKSRLSDTPITPHHHPPPPPLTHTHTQPLVVNKKQGEQKGMGVERQEEEWRGWKGNGCCWMELMFAEETLRDERKLSEGGVEIMRVVRRKMFETLLTNLFVVKTSIFFINLLISILDISTTALFSALHSASKRLSLYNDKKHHLSEQIWKGTNHRIGETLNWIANFSFAVINVI